MNRVKISTAEIKVGDVIRHRNEWQKNGRSFVVESVSSGAARGSVIAWGRPVRVFPDGGYVTRGAETCRVLDDYQVIERVGGARPVPQYVPPGVSA